MYSLSVYRSDIICMGTKLYIYLCWDCCIQTYNILHGDREKKKNDVDDCDEKKFNK